MIEVDSRFRGNDELKMAVGACGLSSLAVNLSHMLFRPEAPVFCAVNVRGGGSLLVLDDFGLAQPNPDNRRDLLELLEDRYASRSTLVTSQLPLAQWHELLGDPTLADAILDRLVHNAYKLQLKGGSMRKHHSGLTHADHCTA